MIPKLYSSTALVEPLELFGQLIAQAPFAIWVAERSGKIVLFNETMKGLLGIVNPEKILGTYNIFEDPIATAQGLVPYIKRVLTGEVVQTVVMLDTSVESFGDPKDPKILYVRCLYYPVTDSVGNFEYVVMLVENITQPYLDDLALTKAAHEIAKANDEMVGREQVMIGLKKRIAELKKKIAERKDAL